MKRLSIFLFTTICLVLFMSVIAPKIVSAGEQLTYKPIVGIPIPSAAGISRDDMTAEDFVRIIYYLSISIAGILAVIKIIMAGVKYMLSDVVTNKQEAKDDIKGALLGLLIVLSAVLILQTINPNLTDLKIFKGPSIEADKIPQGTSGVKRAD